MTQLFTAQAADGVSAAFVFLGRGPLNLYLAGSLGGGTVTLEALTPDGAAWLPLAGSEMTAAGLHLPVTMAAPFVGRLRLTGATSPSLDAWAETNSATTYRRVLEA